MQFQIWYTAELLINSDQFRDEFLYLRMNKTQKLDEIEPLNLRAILGHFFHQILAKCMGPFVV